MKRKRVEVVMLIGAGVGLRAACSLVGVPVVLVADLAVDPDQRRRGLARNLQRFAYACMRGAGYRWVYGNIDPGNLASRGQAEAVGREVWFQAVRFRKEGNEK